MRQALTIVQIDTPVELPFIFNCSNEFLGQLIICYGHRHGLWLEVGPELDAKLACDQRVCGRLDSASRWTEANVISSSVALAWYWYWYW